MISLTPVKSRLKRIKSGEKRIVVTIPKISSNLFVAAGKAGPLGDKAENNTVELMEKLKALLPSNPFVIPKSRVEAIKKALNLSTEELLLRLIPVAKKFARPPISNYQVGAAGLGKSGAIYLGVNLEFPGFPLNQTVHGEQFVTANAFNHGETGLLALAISAAPCGHCRQWLNELGPKNQLQILLPNRKPAPFRPLLPHAFGPGDLGLKGGLLTPVHNGLRIPAGHRHDPLSEAALTAANRAYSPYAHAPSGVALKTRDGKIYAGAYLENAAFNPSLSPLQGALISLVADGKGYDAILEACLVEKKGGSICQELVTRDLLKQIAPQARFHKITVA